MPVSLLVRLFHERVSTVTYELILKSLKVFYGSEESLLPRYVFFISTFFILFSWKVLMFQLSLFLTKLSEKGLSTCIEYHCPKGAKLYYVRSFHEVVKHLLDSSSQNVFLRSFLPLHKLFSAHCQQSTLIKRLSYPPSWKTLICSSTFIVFCFKCLYPGQFWCSLAFWLNVLLLSVDIPEIVRQILTEQFIIND